MQELSSTLTALQNSQKEIIPLLQAGASTPDWSPADDRWSFRFLAAHLAATEKECFLERARRFQTEKNPTFSYYHNTDRDFSQQSIQDAIEIWKQSRQDLIQLVQGMDQTVRSKIATHERMGEMDVSDLLSLILDHDQEHKDELINYLRTREDR